MEDETLVTEQGTAPLFPYAQPPTTWRWAWRNGTVRLTASGVVIVLVLSGLTLLRTPPRGPAEAVLASVEATAARGNASVTLEARSEFVLEAPDNQRPGQRPGAPRFASAPPELRPLLLSNWQQQLRAFEGSASGTPTGQPPTDARAAVTATARGAADFSTDTLLFNGHVTSGKANAPFSVAADSQTTAYRAGIGKWIRLTGPAGALGTVLLDPQAVLRIAASPLGDVIAMGETTVAGEVVRRYRFTIAPEALSAQGAPDGWKVDAYVGRDGLLHQLELQSDEQARGLGSRSHIRVTLAHGGGVEVPPVPRTTGIPQPLPGQLSLPLYPLGPSIAEVARAEAGRP